ncbi:hypothetical protein BD309DRAFT_85764 [Dichomitus squalens]|uniref:DNA replication regulator Sld3 C-terminal domain-containing protein n=1 Tax=Dichomitus squalens TaxID=114155 RepID=A0A4Q9PGV6_9APHY|nr:hypothetical protein BD309DRAFT_85764 [Dichomitus squalens]TBU53815.1 hypothetical protein BD310DRAFT_128757 [Dichomitus squalens]
MLLHFLLISLPGDHAAPYTKSAQAAIAEPLPLPPSLSPTKPKKRKHKDRGTGRALDPPPQSLEERLESYMDKLAMWQLMQSVDSSLNRGRHMSGSAADKGKGKQTDDRDWMQIFCEDVVEPLFKEKLPDLCSLFHSKLFPDIGNSDTDSLGLSPPISPKPATKRLKSFAHTAASVSATTSTIKTQGKDKGVELRTRSRSSSLSLSLEQEKRERSRSLSIRPNGLRKRTTVYEVTMTTKFGKARAKQKVAERTATVPGSSLSRTQSQQSVAGGVQNAINAEKSSRPMGSVLVAATPSKPRETLSRSQSHKSQTQSQFQSRLPSLFAEAPIPPAHSQPSQVAISRAHFSDDSEEDEERDAVVTPTKARRHPIRAQILEEVENEGDDWNLSSSPGTLHLGPSNSQPWSQPEDDGPLESSSPGDLGGFGDVITPPRQAIARGTVMVEDTPTKG